VKGMRISDLRLRCAVCIETRTMIKKESVCAAAARVAILLGRISAEQIDVIRSAYYDIKPVGRAVLDSFYDSFLYWRALVFTYDAKTLGCIGASHATSVTKLYKDIRNDSLQAQRNRDCLLAPAKAMRDRIEGRAWDLPSEMYFLAGRLTELARFYVKVG